MTVENNSGAGLAFSPDGSTLAITASIAQGKTQLWTRRLDALAVQPIAGTDDASYPFWSPDGTFLGFFADGKLKKMGLPGGAVQTICEAKDGRGAAWLADGTIVFAPEPNGPLYRVQATGGTPVAMTKVEGPRVTHRLPRNMPDARRVLFYEGGEGSVAGAYIIDLSSGMTTLVVPGDSEARWVPPDWFVYVNGRQLIAQRRSLDDLRPLGEPIPIAENVRFIVNRHTGNFALSDNGALAYSVGIRGVRSRLTWFDLNGKKLSTVGEPAPIDGFSLSPDSARAIVRTESDRQGTDLGCTTSHVESPAGCHWTSAGSASRPSGRPMDGGLRTATTPGSGSRRPTTRPEVRTSGDRKAGSVQLDPRRPVDCLLDV